jgi:hypothetical protein
MTLVCDKLGVVQSTSLPRNPQCQDLVEEKNKVFKRKVEQKALVMGWKLSRTKHHTMEWRTLVEEILRNENDVPCKTYNTLCPYFCLFNRPRNVGNHQPFNSLSIAEIHTYMYERQKEVVTKRGQSVPTPDQVQFDIGDTVTVPNSIILVKTIIVTVLYSRQSQDNELIHILRTIIMITLSFHTHTTTPIFTLRFWRIL